MSPKLTTPCLLAVLATSLLLAGSAVAEPVAGEVFPMRQPDGSTIDVRIWGDEFYTIVESLDGYTLVRDPETRFICYAALSADGNNLLSTGVPVGSASPAELGLVPQLRVNPRAAAAQARAVRDSFARRAFEGPLAPSRDRATRGPTTGDVVGITLIIDFSDDVGTIPPSEVDDYCNEIGYNNNGNNGSVRDYFHDVSDEALNYTNFVPAAYYRAQHPKSYYNDPDISFGIRARELIIEALNHLNSTGFDFSQYDANNDNVVDALNCFYAGYRDSAWAEGLWPHAWTVNFCADGVCTYRYQMTDMQSSLRLSTFCHENGHMLMGWPDLYDYDYDSTGVGRFCLMCYSTSSTNPQEPCAYMKYDAGWGDVTILSSPQSNLPVPSTSNVIYKYPHPYHSYEYYLIENRQRAGRDSGLPDDGLAIWHVDTTGSNDNQQQTPSSHYLVTLVQADGDWDLENDRNYGDSTDLYAAPYFTACTPDTYPNTDWWSGSPSGLEITGISVSGTIMTFNMGGIDDCNANGVDDADDFANCDGSPWCSDCNNNGVIDACDIHYGGSSSDCDNNGVPDECDPDCDQNGVPDGCQLGRAGLTGTYYDTIDFTGPGIGRLDATISFNWGNGSPMPEIGDNTFSVRWEGYLLTPSVSGTYWFYANTDDGVRLWVNGELLIDQWVDQAPTEVSAYMLLEREETYAIKMEYYENSGGAVAELRWQPPGYTKALIPSSRLLSGRDCNQNGLPDTCDLASGVLTDANGNGLPDECELIDCNNNGIADADDIAGGFSEDCDGNGVPDECQPDGDNDGTIDACDDCPEDPFKTDPGVCGCGVPDLDLDGDGVPFCIDECPNDPNKVEAGICGCGVPDIDSDDDGVYDCNDGCPEDPDKTEPGACGCGVPDIDSDDDGVYDCNDGCPEDPDKTEPGACGCGVPDIDSDNDGVADCIDQCPGHDDNVDCDQDGIPDGCDGPDCNANGVPDNCDIAGGTSDDVNGDGIPDECQTLSCPGDANCDGQINWQDINYFVAAQNNNEAAWRDMFAPAEPDCPFANNDVNGDGIVNWRDIDPFVMLQNTTCP